MTSHLTITESAKPKKGRLILDQPPSRSFNFQLLKTLLASR